MAQKTTKKVSPTPSKQPTAAEMRDFYEKNKKRIENFDSADAAIRSLRDVTKTATKTVSAFSKDSLRTYLQNIGSNARNLRNLSRYLYYRCHAYYRWIMYNATMFDLSCRSVIPKYDMVKGGDKNKTLKSYYNTLTVLDEMNVQYEFLKALTVAFREDVFYGCAYYTEGEGMFILPLDPDYCTINGIFNDGSYSFAMDMTYFRSRQFELEAWGEPFVSMHRDYESSGAKYQTMPPEYSVCLKSRPETWDLEVPVASGLLNSIIGLIDIEDIQAIADEAEIYKMLWIELQTIGEDVDDWRIDPSIVVEYFNRMINEALPDYVSAAIIPGKLESISFDNNKVDEVNKVTKTTEALFNSAGGAQILNSASISGTTAFTAAIQADTELAISALLPQLQAITNRLLYNYVGKDAAKVKFFEVSVYTKGEFQKKLLEGATYGTPTILAYNACNHFSELDTMALNFLENECLDLHSKFIPVQSSHTTAGGSETGGAPEKDADEISDDGEASKEKRDRANG